MCCESLPLKRLYPLTFKYLNLFHLQQHCAINENKCCETVITTTPYFKTILLYPTF